MIDFLKGNLDVVGGKFGDVYPPEPPTSGSGLDPREHALIALRRFISALAFERKMAPGQRSRRFVIPISQIHIYQPDDVKDVGVFPAIGIRPSLGTHDTVSLGPATVDDSSEDKFGLGTALIERSEYMERLGIEVLGAKHAQRVAVVAGLQEALTCWESSYALRLRIPEYYDQIATFELDQSEYIDDDPVFKNRRRADLYVNMVVPEVSLVNVKPFRPEVIRTVGPDVLP